MAELRLHGRLVPTVFDLLGSKEDDITYSVGWGLAQSDALAYALLGEVFAGELGPITAILLQQTETDTGRTDIEVQTRDAHLIVEAKRGWNMPTHQQLDQYAKRLAQGEERRRAIAVVTEAATHFPPARQLPSELRGVPIHYVPWSRVAQLVATVSGESSSHAEKRLLAELHRYLRSLMTSQDVTSNLVYVVSLNREQHDWSAITFVQTVMEYDRYYHPVGGGPGGQGWPKVPPNYLGFRFDGRLQRISFVERYEVITRPHDHISAISPSTDWSGEPHFLYHLGPALPLPQHPVRTKDMFNRRVRVALDLLLTCSTLRDAELKTKERMDEAGATAE